MRSKSMLNKSWWCLLFLLPIAVCSTAMGKIIYVDDDVAGVNDGSSWQNAYVYLQDALADANSAEKPSEIRVAQGIYKPDQGAFQIPGDREATFRLINGVAFKGGYAGLGEPNPDARNVELYETILSGDLNSDDIKIDNVEIDYPWDLLDEPTRAENSYNVVVSIGTDDSAVLDGFTITNGNANHRSSLGFPALTRTVDDRLTHGAGMFNIFVGPIVINCTFTENSGSAGGGMFNYDCSLILNNSNFSKNFSMCGGGILNNECSLILTNCTFSENQAGDGGGICSDGWSILNLTDCTFIGNSAEFNGGGMDGGTATLTNCAFFANDAVQGSGLITDHSILTDCTFIANKAIYWGGGISSWSNDTVSHCTFSGNSAGICGGAIYTFDTDLTLTNCTLTGNSALNGSALACVEVDKAPSNIELTNCILWDIGNEIWNDGGSTIVISYSDIQGGQAGVHDPCNAVVWGEGNINADPLFADPGYWTNLNDPNIIVEPNDPNNELWVDGDYHLKSEAGRWDPNSESWVIDDVTSPCIDAGDPLTPVMYEPHPRGCFINMGAYGGTEEASKSHIDGSSKKEG